MSAEPMGRSTTTAEFRSHLGEYLDAAQREPVAITNRGRRRAVLVSEDFFERALAALEDAEDVAAAREARRDPAPRFTLAEVMADLGLTHDDLRS
ncbi:type II toxin-antitoxin system Phd/YefM family antitoxin [Cellulomonas denverensis]|nr:type II toxin-antitoxin system Phd/YefM family antitoxin [Cellulomonas denverensis]